MVLSSAGWRRRKPEVICGVLSLGALLYLGHFLWHRHFHVDSANATLQGYPIALGTPVAGEVVEVLVDENQRVKKGQLLCRLENRQQRASLLAAEARLAAVAARSEEAARNQARYNWLLRRQSATARDRDQAAAASLALKESRKAAEAEVQAQRIRLSRSAVTAPGEGVIAFRTAQPGFFARSGAPLFGFVPDAGRWVEAKVKETDLADFGVNDAVEIRFDAAPGRVFRGHVASVAPATEVPFAADPADPAAGNFTKYVQWQPVRVAVDLSAEDRARIPLGASAEIRMRRR